MVAGPMRRWFWEVFAHLPQKLSEYLNQGHFRWYSRGKSLVRHLTMLLNEGNKTGTKWANHVYQDGMNAGHFKSNC